MVPVFAKKTSVPIFAPKASFGMKNNATDAEKHGESKFTAKNVPKLTKKPKFQKTRILKKFKILEISEFLKILSFLVVVGHFWP